MHRQTDLLQQAISTKIIKYETMYANS